MSLGTLARMVTFAKGKLLTTAAVSVVKKAMLTAASSGMKSRTNPS